MEFRRDQEVQGAARPEGSAMGAGVEEPKSDMMSTGPEGATGATAGVEIPP